MITASLKQHIRKRPSRTPSARFKLLVAGRVRGVWEKKSYVPKLVLYKKNTAFKIKAAGWRQRLRHFRLPVFIFLSLLGLCLIALLFFSFTQPPQGPLELPAENGILQDAFGDTATDSDAAATEAPSAPSALRKLKLSTYRVKSRETLPAIAKKTGLDVDTLISFNSIKDASALKPGAALTLPNRRGLRYRVRAGDSLTKICKQYGVSLDDLLDWNNLARSVIIVGQGLFIPGGRLSAAEVSRVLGTTFVWPVRGSISSYYGMRISPITGTRMHHNGLDITNGYMTPIAAAAPGRVAIVDYNPTYGNFIILVHDNGFQTLYGHLQATYVKRGKSVARGEKIGAMGSTGASTGCHLHFSIFRSGRDVDPLKYLP